MGIAATNIKQIPTTKEKCGYREAKAMQIPTTSEKRGYREAEVSLYTQEEKYDWVWRRQKLGKYPQKEKKAPTIIVSAFFLSLS